MVAVVYVAAMFMAVMDTTVVNVALPALGRDFHAGAGSVGLVSVAYLVSLAVFIPASGWLGDRIGDRTALLGAIGVFTAASALCGTATTLYELVAFRVLQGVGGAVMTPVGLSMLFKAYPPAERVRVAGILAVFTALGPALGPVLGGVFTTYLSWRLVFFVNVPIGVAVLVYGALLLAGHAPSTRRRLDVPGFALSGLGLGCTMYGISEGPGRGWSAAPVLITIAVGAALLVAMVAVELRAHRPLIDLRLFGNRLFTASTGLYALGSASYIGTLFLTALFLQDGLGLSAVQTGLATFPSALGTMAGGRLVTRALYWRFGPRRITAAGLAAIAAATALMALVTTGDGLWPVRLIMFGLGLGVSFVFIPAQAASMATVPHARTAPASAIYNAAKQLGSAVGVTLLTTVLTVAAPARAASGRPVSDLTAFHAGFLAATAVALCAIPVALTIRDADASATMVPPRRRGAAKPRTQASPADPATGTD